MTFIEACSGTLIQAYLQNQDITQYCHVLRVYESICKEWLTAQLIVYDNNNIIEQMNIQAGDPAGFAFLSPPNPFIYNVGTQFGGGNYGNMMVLKMKGEPAPDSFRYSIYTIDLIGPVFYANQRQTIFDTVSAGGTGTGQIKQIWDQYLPDTLNILTSSMGQIGDPNASASRGGQKPLTAIHQIMREMVSSTNQELSNWLLYKNRDGVNLVQLPDLFNGIGPAGGYLPPQNNAHGLQDYFVQKETWGANAGDGITGFNDRDYYHGIVAVQAEARQGTGSGGSSSGVNIASAVSTRQFTQDIMSGNILSQPLQALGLGNIGSLFSSIGGGGSGTGLAGNQVTNSKVWANATAPFTKTAGEMGFGAAVKNAAQLVMKVPLQTGINVTVGKGIWAYLLPAVLSINGQTGRVYDNLTGGWLVTDLVHELYTDQRQGAATTVMQLNQGPGDNLAD